MRLGPIGGDSRSRPGLYEYGGLLRSRGRATRDKAYAVPDMYIWNYTVVSQSDFAADGGFPSRTRWAGGFGMYEPRRSE